MQNFTKILDALILAITYQVYKFTLGNIFLNQSKQLSHDGSHPAALPSRRLQFLLNGWQHSQLSGKNASHQA